MTELTKGASSLRLTALGLIAVGLIAMQPAGVEAHVSAKGTWPKANSRAKTSIDVVKVAFSGPLRSGTIRVTGPRGRVSVGAGGRDPRRISRLIVPLKRGLAPGRYRVAWTAIAADGHRQSGSFRFRLVR